jgi:hypothetical protein
MILLKQLLTEITLTGAAPYATEFTWDEQSSSRHDIEFVETRVSCDGHLMAFNFDKQWGRDDEANWSFSILSKSTDPDTERTGWTISHARSDATGKISYLRLMSTVLECILDFIRIYDATSIDVTGSDNLPDKDLQKTRIYRALLAANAAEITTAGYNVLDRSGKLFLVRRTRADASGIRDTAAAINETDMIVDPFILTATKSGNIKITNNTTNIVHLYKMEAQLGFVWIPCTIQDFPGGTSIQLQVSGLEKTETIDKKKLKTTLAAGFGKSSFEKTLKSGQPVKFTKLG